MTTGVQEQMTASIRFSSKSVCFCQELRLYFIIDVLLSRERRFTDIQNQEHDEGLAKSSYIAQEYNSLQGNSI